MVQYAAAQLDASFARAYHDLEWGVPIRDERRLFELLVLEGAQAGLSWWTILRKRDGYRAAFADFDPAAVAAFGDDDVARLMADPGIVRNAGKIAAAIGNARATLELEAAGSSLAEHLWSFVGGLARGGTAVVFTTHNVAEAERYADRLLVLADGELLFEGTPRALHEAVGTDAYDFEAAFVAFLRERGH